MIRNAQCWSCISLLLLMWGQAGCSSQDGLESVPKEAEEEDLNAPSLVSARKATSRATPIGLALEINNGHGVPMRVRSGQTFYINQLDIRAAIENTPRDEGIQGLQVSGDFSTLAWGSNTSFSEGDLTILPNLSGSYTRRKFFKKSLWMEKPSVFRLEQLNAHNEPLGPPMILFTGEEQRRRVTDSFFIRRTRGIQWTYDCPKSNDCTGAMKFGEEALLELRSARNMKNVVTLHPQAKAFRLQWSIQNHNYMIPIEQIENPEYDYGLQIDITPITKPSHGTTYPPGSKIQFQVTLRDGSGNRLHPEGALPTYNSVYKEENTSGIQYYRGFEFIEPTITYYRRKHRERMMMSQIIGPAQKVQPIRSFVEVGQFFGQDDVQTVGLPERDGFFAAYRTFPAGNDLFGGGFDPAHTAWKNPVPDTWA